MDKRLTPGFTLLELSVVLVVIGLIIGGILVGQDLIRAALLRSQISQIEKYKTATATFKAKYNYLPGDLPAAQASALGFVARAGGTGDGDGNGLVEPYGGLPLNLFYSTSGEQIIFWDDLSSANLVEGYFTQNGDSHFDIGTSPNSNPALFAPYVPLSKIATNAYVFAFANYDSGGYGIRKYTGLVFGIAVPQFTFNQMLVTADSMTTADAQAIDSKMDDGVPQKGLVYSMGPGQFGAGSSLGYDGTPGFTSDYCVNFAARYNTSTAGNTSINCNLMFASGF